MPNKTKVGLQLSVGGLGDLSFNDSAYAGLQEAQQLHGIEFQTAPWENPMLNAINLENWAKEDFDLIIGYWLWQCCPHQRDGRPLPRSTLCQH